MNIPTWWKRWKERFFGRRAKASSPGRYRPLHLLQLEERINPAPGDFGLALGLGGAGFDEGRSIVARDGFVYVTGSFSNTVDFDPGPGTVSLTSAGLRDIFVAKYTDAGALVWAKRMGDSGSDAGNAIVVDGSGNVYLTGSFAGTVDFDPGPGTVSLTSAGLRDIFVSKLDPDGNLAWAKHMGGNNNDFGYGIAVDAAGNVYTTGTFGSGTADFDPGPAIFNLPFAGGSHDIFVSKLDNSGNFVWAKGVGGIFEDGGKSIALDGSGNVYVTGSFRDTVDFDPGPGIANLTSVGGSDIFVTKMTSSGSFVWAKQLGGVANDFGFGIAVDAAGNVYTTGSFVDTVDFDPGPGIANLTSVDYDDIFVSKLDNNGGFL